MSYMKIWFLNISIIENGTKIRLAEEVTDCGPVIDTEETPGCVLLPDEYNVTAGFPDCCPIYDCEEDAEIVYIASKSHDTKGNRKN